MAEDVGYEYERKGMCEGCGINAGLFHLSHTGLRSGKIFEK